MSEERGQITVPDFPKKVWRKFASVCKAKGINIKLELEQVLRKYNEENRKAGY